MNRGTMNMAMAKTVTAVLTILAGTVAAVHAQTTVTWDGGDGSWTDAKWNGGQTAEDVFGRENGIENAEQVTIGGGSQVIYNAGNPGVNNDFRLRSDNGPTSITVTGGATLELYSQDTDADGKYTQWDGDLILDNGTLKRTFGAGSTGSTISGGAHMLGSWNSFFGEEVEVTLINGGRYENHGMLMFGAWNESAISLKVTVTIDDGSIDLTGGDAFILNDFPEQNADLHFYYGTDGAGLAKDESYVINFTGPGSIAVDSAGIRVHEIGADYSSWFDEARTYQQLWEMGILQANGLSGVDGETFEEFFMVENALGEDDYTLISLLGANFLPGDFDKNGAVDGNDFLTWQANFPTESGATQADGDANGDGAVDGNDFLLWQANFGSAAGGGSGVVPEPAAASLLLAAVAGFVARRNRR